MCVSYVLIGVSIIFFFFFKQKTAYEMQRGLVGSEMCIRDRYQRRVHGDFGRVGVDGKPRELHIDKAVAVSNLKPSEKNGEADGEAINHGSYVSKLLTDNEYFTCTKYDVDGELKLDATVSSFNSIIILEGNGQIKGNSGDFEVCKGDSFFIPAGYGAYTILGNVSLILTKLQIQSYQEKKKKKKKKKKTNDKQQNIKKKKPPPKHTK
eukprot:TRINITY_DN25463_c0_g1_i6.p1 TRINITY_DN25463_c0_g1~~TRINITY_DN25463_c0_g1_i6.p1  ORF type:complete len:208 (+),score=64.27 TRINITY_DN25463_c0_g1_i6:35-658(+)